MVQGQQMQGQQMGSNPMTTGGGMGQQVGKLFLLRLK
jgi:hypothetical protein